MVDSRSREIKQRAIDRCSQVARHLGTTLNRVGRTLDREIVEAIPALRSDDRLLDLLRSSTEGNIENFLHGLQHGIPVDELLPPSAAVEYGRRLAQRGISSTTLLRAYRMGQNRVLDLGMSEIQRQEPDREVALEAARILQRAVFDYVDHVAERVVTEYEHERERWLANRNTLRAAMLASVLAGETVDLGAAESALGYRVRRRHLSLVAWTTTVEQSSDLPRLEQLIATIGQSIGIVGHPLVVPRDGSRMWAWLPLDHADVEGPDPRVLNEIVESSGSALRLAVGRAHGGLAGFRRGHDEAVRAYVVASAAGSRSGPVTTFGHPGVQISSILARDIEFTREWVQSVLGGLAADEPAVARLRGTLQAFLQSRGSYLAAAELEHVHRNTVKYRVDKAVEMMGRPIDECRLQLEVALMACQWLGPPQALGSGRD